MTYAEPGLRELAFFLSRFPKAEGIGEWYYNPDRDCWINPVAWRAIKVCAEADISVAKCLHKGLTRERIDKFVADNTGGGDG